MTALTRNRMMRFLSAGAIGVASFPAIATAQDSGTKQEPEAVLEDIVVTAQKREERLQTTPLAISAVSAKALTQRGATDISSVAQMVPNLTVTTTAPLTGASSAATFTIRGVGQLDFSLAAEPGVGVYVDNIYMARSIGGVLDLLDLERIEVLRGPQGTLFGRNTIGGAVSLISQKPKSDFGGTFEFTGGNRKRLDLRGSVNLPLVDDKLLARLSVSSRNQDGYVKGLVDDRRYGDVNRDAARLQLLARPADNLELNFSADGTRIREQSAPSTLVGVNLDPPGGRFGIPSLSFLYNVFDAPTTNIPGFGNVPYDARFIPSDIDTTYATGPNGTSIDIWGVSGSAELQLSSTATLKSFTAFRKTDGTFGNDPDGSPLLITHISNQGYHQKQFSQEFQVNLRALNDRLKLVGGAFYLKETGREDVFVPLVPSFGTVHNLQVVSTTSLAAYAQGTLELLTGLSLTAGLRYTRDRRNFTPEDASLTLGFAGANLAFPALGLNPGDTIALIPIGVKSSRKFTDVSPKFGVDYKWSDQLFTYASYSRGFKSGGFNVRYLNPSPSAISYDPETLRTFEVGAKWSPAGGRFRANIAAFRSLYSDIQLQVFTDFGTPVLLNAGKAKLNGVELEVNAIPLDGLTLSSSVSFLDSYYTSVSNPTPGVSPILTVDSTDRLPNAPKWSFSNALQYEVATAADGALSVRGEWIFVGSHAVDAQNSVFLNQKRYHLFNASLRYANPSQNWSLSLFCNNISNERYIQTGNSNYPIGFHEANYNRPRDIGLSLRVTY